MSTLKSQIVRMIGAGRRPGRPAAASAIDDGSYRPAPSFPPGSLRAMPAQGRSLEDMHENAHRPDGIGQHGEVALVWFDKAGLIASDAARRALDRAGGASPPRIRWKPAEGRTLDAIVANIKQTGGFGDGSEAVLWWVVKEDLVKVGQEDPAPPPGRLAEPR